MINNVRCKCCEPQVQSFGKSHASHDKKSTAKKVAAGIGIAAGVAGVGVAVVKRKSIMPFLQSIPTKIRNFKVKEALTSAKEAVTTKFTSAKDAVVGFFNNIRKPKTPPTP